MRHSFYDSAKYKEKQRQITKKNNENGIYDHLRQKVERICVLEKCKKIFITQPADKKRFCSRSCANSFTNTGRTRSINTRKKIGDALRGKAGWSKGKILSSREQRECPNDWCEIVFEVERWKQKRFCSASCAAKRPTSPKASRGKSGIRPDISLDINFHSRWEANVARMYTFLGIEWKYEPVTFDIGGHTYTPDFYLPRYNEFLEVKNFWSNYSIKRDRMFRSTNPNIYLRVLLKDEYMALQKRYGKTIRNWEFSK